LVILKLQLYVLLLNFIDGKCFLLLLANTSDPTMCREYFQDKFFHSVWESDYGPNKVVTTSPYCKFDSQTLQLFQSSLYIAGMPSLLSETTSLVSGTEIVPSGYKL